MRLTSSKSSTSRTIDHIIPQSRGGDFSIGNLVPCCGPCNLMKDTLELADWLVRIEHIAGRIRGMVVTG